MQPPTNLTATAGNSQVALAWTASTSSGVGGHRVYHENANGTWPTTPLATAAATTSGYTDTGLANGTAETYRVTTVSTATPPGESTPSNTATATPTAPAANPAARPRRRGRPTTTSCGS